MEGVVGRVVVRPVSSNHEPLSDQNLPCFIPVFRSGLSRCGRSANPLPCLNESEVNISLYFNSNCVGPGY